MKIFLSSSIDKVASPISEQLNMQPNAKLAFIITASETETDDLDWRDRDRKALVTVGFEVTDYTFTDKTKEQIKADLETFDVICIEGGDTFYLLEKIQQSGCQDVIRNLVHNGKPYIGSSAGSIVAGPDIYPIRHLENATFDRLSDYKGLGLVNFVIFPHWGSEFFKDLYLERRLEYNYNLNHKFMLLTDNQYVYVDDTTMKFIDVVLDAPKP